MDLKRICLLLAILLLCLMPMQCVFAAEQSNLLLNADFEELDQYGMPRYWKTSAYRNAEGYTVFSAIEDGMDGNAAMIQSFTLNDARFYQEVAVEPNTTYCLSGYIKASTNSGDGWGANLSIEGVYLNVDGQYDTNGEWQYTEIYGQTGPDQTSVTVFVRLGGYSSESDGKGIFDNLSLIKAENVPWTTHVDQWYKAPVIEPVQADQPDDPDIAKPFWPMLLLLSLVYMTFGVIAMLQLRPARQDLNPARKLPMFLVIGLAAAFVLRYMIAILVEGYQVDVNCFLSWSSTMASVGPGNFYQSTWCDYPPGYTLVLGFNGLINQLIGTLFRGETPVFLSRIVIIKLLPMFCDIAMALVIYHMARKRSLNREQSGLLSLLVAFNPVLIINSAAWCQVDSVLALLLLLVIALALDHRWTALMPVYMLAVLMKPQALMVGPLGLIALLTEFIVIDSDTKKLHFSVPASWKQMLIGLGLALAVALCVLLPFIFGANGLHLLTEDGSFWLIDLYGQTLGSYPYATVNTTNLYYIFNANWASLEQNASFMLIVVLIMFCLGWGTLCVCRNHKDHRRFWWAEGFLMAAFGSAFIIMAVMGCTWSVVGFTAMGFAFAVVVPLFLRANRMDVLPLLGGLLFLMLYVLGIKMHERYLFPAIVMFAAAFIVHRDIRILIMMAAASCVMFVNEGIVLDNSLRLGSSMGHLNADTSWLNLTLSVINVLLVPFAMFTASDRCLYADVTLDSTSPLKLPFGLHYEQKPTSVLQFKPDHKLHWKKADTALMLIVTLIYSIVALCNLGSTKAPQTTWVSTTFDEQIVLDLGDHYDDFTMLYFCQVSYDDFSVATSDDGQHWVGEYWAQMNEGSCYKWQYLMPCTSTGGEIYYSGINELKRIRRPSGRTIAYLKPSTYVVGEQHSYSGGNKLTDVQRLSGRYVRVSAHQISLKLNEVVFRDAAGQTITAKVVLRSGENIESPLLTDPNCIVDEPDSIEGEPGWYNSTYFDEIYHARTAKELLDGTAPYEWTHPPLGKVIMSWMIAIFGMTPFGWRFAGALVGILMLPALYVLAKQLTKRTDMAFLAMTLFALDCMHYTQTRLATIDSYPVLFIILSFLFMVRFMQRDAVMVPIKQLLPDLALSGFFMGCGIASKWIGIYSGAGLAVLYFWTCARHIRLGVEARKQLIGSDGLSEAQQTELQHRSNTYLTRLLFLCLWCVLFFVIIPAMIYLMSYMPHFAYAKPENLIELVKLIIKEQQRMFDYHSTPGLGMDHAFYSPWYEWPMIKRPMYYAMAYFMPAGYSQAIFCFGNPAVWALGLIGMAITLALWLKRHIYSMPGSDTPIHLASAQWNIGPAVVMIGMLAQFLPWVLVPRGTYIYHFFASIPFLILGFTLSMNILAQCWPKATKWLIAIVLIVCLAWFIAYYPYASGVPTPVRWLDFMRKPLNVYYSL